MSGPTEYLRFDDPNPTPQREAFLAAVRHVLDEARPHQVLPEQTVVAHEDPGAPLAAVIPHRSLDGLALIVFGGGQSGGLQPNRAAISWGWITTLRRHDELDAATSVKEVGTSEDFVALQDALRLELGRAIDVRVSLRKWRAPLLTCSVEGVRGGRWSGPNVRRTLDRNVLPVNVRTSLASGSDAPVHFPPPTDWYWS
ncbi:MAG: hypothetical protein JWL76_1967 [Thermoleophilia bacterium]|nr:hypothetical protein [Thermoleophilia bacterium]